MAPSLEVASAPGLDGLALIDKKEHVTVQAIPTSSPTALQPESASAAPVQRTYHPVFELEEHPVDDIRKLRVSNPNRSIEVLLI